MKLLELDIEKNRERKVGHPLFPTICPIGNSCKMLRSLAYQKYNSASKISGMS